MRQNRLNLFAGQHHRDVWLAFRPPPPRHRTEILAQHMPVKNSNTLNAWF